METSLQNKLYFQEIVSHSVQMPLQEEASNNMIRNIHQNKRIIGQNNRKGFLSPTSNRNPHGTLKINMYLGDSNKELKKEELIQECSSNEIEQQSQQQMLTEKQNYKTPMIIHNKKVPKVFQNYLDFSNNKVTRKNYQSKKSINDSVNKEDIISQQKQIRIRRVKSPKAEIYSDKNQKQNILIKKVDNSMEIPDFDQIVLNHQTKKTLQPIKASQISRAQNFISIKPELPKFQKRHSILNPSILQQIKINEMATIIKFNTNQNSQFKKVIHIPTLQSFTIKESLINETSASIMEQISLWNKLEGKNPLFAKIINIYWNTPEGYHSIVMEFADVISLQNILDTCGGLPEQIIQQVSQNIFEIFGVINDNSSKETFAHEMINPSAIYFNKENQLRLYFMNELINSETKTSYFKLKSSICQYYNQTGFPKYNLSASQRKNQCIDYTFEMGLLAFYLALGDLSLMLNVKQYSKSQINYDYQTNKQENCIDNCCLFHSIEHIAKFGSKINKSSNITTQILLRYYTVEQCQLISRILHKNYSQNFRNFLCMCLQYQKHGQCFEKIHSIIASCPFFENKKLKKSQIKLEDLKQIVPPINKELNTEEEFNRICSTFQIILPSCKEWFEQLSGLRLLQNFLNLKNDSEFITILSTDLSLPSESVYQKLIMIIKQSDIFPLRKKLINQQNVYLKKQASGTTTASSSIKSNHTEIIIERNEF